MLLIHLTEGLKSVRFFLYLIEILSLLCRPFALAVRLLVNVTVGVVACEFLYFFGNSYFFSFIVVFIECLVLIIQVYIFCRLIFIYFDE
jgi:F0F1-type ATP synthase membrane subunit a